MATPTANSIRENLHTLCDYMDQRSKMADVNPDVTLDKVYRDLHAIIGLVVELGEDMAVLPTLFGARIVDAPANPDGHRYAVEIYDLGSRNTVATSIPIDFTAHAFIAIDKIRTADGFGFKVAGTTYRTGPGVWGANWIVRRIKVDA